MSVVDLDYSVLTPSGPKAASVMSGTGPLTACAVFDGALAVSALGRCIMPVLDVLGMSVAGQSYVVSMSRDSRDDATPCESVVLDVVGDHVSLAGAVLTWRFRDWYLSQCGRTGEANPPSFGRPDSHIYMEWHVAGMYGCIRGRRAVCRPFAAGAPSCGRASCGSGDVPSVVAFPAAVGVTGVRRPRLPWDVYARCDARGLLSWAGLPTADFV